MGQGHSAGTHRVWREPNRVIVVLTHELCYSPGVVDTKNIACLHPRTSGSGKEPQPTRGDFFFFVENTADLKE